MVKTKKFYYFIIAALALTIIAGCAGSKKNDPAVQMRSQQVQKALGDIAQALVDYKTEHGYFPKGMATLRDAHYLSLMPDVERDWTLKYYIDGGEVMMVEAVSRLSMPDGDGYRIEYRVQEESWGGYGITVFPR